MILCIPMTILSSSYGKKRTVSIDGNVWPKKDGRVTGRGTDRIAVILTVIIVGQTTSGRVNLVSYNLVLSILSTSEIIQDATRSTMIGGLERMIATRVQREVAKHFLSCNKLQR